MPAPSHGYEPQDFDEIHIDLPGQPTVKYGFISVKGAFIKQVQELKSPPKPCHPHESKGYIDAGQWWVAVDKIITIYNQAYFCMSKVDQLPCVITMTTLDMVNGERLTVTDTVDEVLQAIGSLPR